MKSLIYVIRYILAPIVFFLIVIFAISYKSLPTQGIISYNDGTFPFQIIEKQEYNNVYSDDYLGSNKTPLILVSYIKSNIIVGLKQFGISNEYVGYIITFGIIYITSLIYFLVFSKLTKSVHFGYFAGIFVIFNNLVIDNIYYGFIFNTYLSLLALGCAVYFVEKIIHKYNILQNSIILVLLSLLLVGHIYLIGYIMMLIIVFIFLSIDNREYKYIYGLILIIAGIIGINFYWVFPFLINLIENSSGSIYNGNSGAVYNGYKSFVDHISTISLRQYSNSPSLFLNSSNISYIGYILLLSIIVIGFLKGKVLAQNKSYLIFLILYFIFFTVSLGPNGDMTGGIWSYFWDNFGIFHFFRSFTRFLIFLIPIGLLLVGLALLNVKHKNKIIIILSFFFILTHSSLLTGNLKNKILTIKVPQEINEIKNYNIQNLIIFPNNKYESYKWANKSIAPEIQTYFLAESILSKPVLLERESLNLKKRNAEYYDIFGSNIINSDLKKSLEELSVSHVLISKMSINIFSRKVVPYENFLDYFDQNAKILLDNEYYTLYQLPNPQDTLTLDNGDIKINKISSVEYDITMTLNSENDVLRFYKNFDNNWGIFDRNNNELNFEHRVHNDTFNKWIIDVNSLPADKYSLNNDGTYTLDIKMYYKMQDYFIQGKQISFWFIILTILLLIFGIFKKRKGRTNIS